MRKLYDSWVRLAGHCLTRLRSLNELYLEGSGSADVNTRQFRDEWAVILYAWRWVVAQYEAGAADEAVRTLCKDFPNVGAHLAQIPMLLHPREAIRLLEAATSAARELKDPAGEANRLGRIGLAYAALGDSRRAAEYHKRHLAIASALENRAGEGVALINLGAALVDSGEFEQALRIYERKLQIARETGDRLGESRVLGNIGVVHNKLGDYVSAGEFHMRRLEITRE